MPAQNRASVVQRAADKRNASRPQTERHKEIARANALQFGFKAAELALQVEDVNQVDAILREVHDQLCPQTVIGSFLASLVALDSVRVIRAARAEAANLRHKVRHAEANHDEARRADADHLLGWIGREPVTYRRQLLATPEGVDCLVKALERLLEDVGFEAHLWDVNQEMKLEAYFGRRSDDVPLSRGRRLSKAIQGDLSELSDADATKAQAKGGRIWAVEQMQVYIADEINHLKQFRESFDHAAIARDRAEAIERATVDVGKAAPLAKKSEVANRRDLFRALDVFETVEASHDSDASADNVPALPKPTDPIALPQVQTQPDPKPEPEPTLPPVDINISAGKDLRQKMGSFGNSVSTSNPWSGNNPVNDVVDELIATRKAFHRRRLRRK